MLGLNPLSRYVNVLALAGLCCVASISTTFAAESGQVKRLFADPPTEYSTAPFWVWNDLLTSDQIVNDLRDFAARDIKQVIVHPRPGLMTPYLSDYWFNMWDVALREAERLGMDLWIYDENSYPSGFAGGHVPAAMPEARGRGLAFREETSPPTGGKDVLATYRLVGGRYERIDGAAAKPTTDAAEADVRYLVASVQRSGDAPWFGGKCYVDLLYPGVTEKFLDVTMKPYERRWRREFGGRIPGVFTDEPELCPAGGLPWTDDLPAQFERRWGYRLLDHLPCLNGEVGDWKRVRHNYYQLLLELFVERWGKPYYEYCERTGLEFTGHYWEHEWPNCRMVPDNMAMAAWQQRPGIDILMNEYSEDVHGQFGNARAVRELASVASQLGRARTLCEAYGAGGWDLRFEDMKRIGDWLYVLGVNTMNQHLSYVTIRGARKRDHPQSFSYHDPWWEAYGTQARYFARLSAALSQGRQVNRVLLLEPTTTAWMYNGGDAAALNALGAEFQRLVMDLEKAQIEYDLGCEEIIAGHGSVAEKSLVVGQCRYDVVVLPPATENLNEKTAERLAEFVRGGGTVFCCGEPPSRVEGRPSDQLAKLAERDRWRKVSAVELPKRLRTIANDGFDLQPSSEQPGLVFHQRRRIDDGQFVFIVNTDMQSSARGVIEARAGGAERWDLDTGEVRGYPSEAAENGIQSRYDLPPSGSLLLFLPDGAPSKQPPAEARVRTFEAQEPPTARRIGPNVLVLDYVDVAAGSGKQNNQYVLKAADYVFKRNGLEGDPWAGAVQYRDEILNKKFPSNSGFEATYRFTIRDEIPAALFFAVERPDLYAIECNGRPVQPVAGEWWLDRSIGLIDIAAVAKVGENVIELKARPFTVFHELEAAYVLGDFALEAQPSGFVIAPPLEIELGPWNDQGCPFYSTGVGYAETFDVSSASGRYRVRLGDWYGAVAQVLVNGQPAGFIGSPPWECDVTDQIRDDENTVEVVVFGTLKNTLGPHHGNPPLGRAWPGMFQQAPENGPPPGGDYNTVGYGLFAPFRLERVIE